MNDIVNETQEPDSSDCGYFCAYIAVEINRGLAPFDINFNRSMVYGFRNRFTGGTGLIKSPASSSGLNSPTQMASILQQAGAPGYRVASLSEIPGEERQSFLRRNCPRAWRDVMLIALPARRHWMMIIGMESPHGYTVYDSSARFRKGHLFAVDPGKMDTVFNYTEHVVTRVPR